MKTHLRRAILGLVGLLLAGSGLGAALAQPAAPGNFNFDPAQIQAQILKAQVDRYRDQLEVKDDMEWQLIGERVQKVVEARRDAGLGGGGRSGFGGRGGFGGGFGGGRGGFGGNAAPPSPEEEALQKAIENKVPSGELKTVLARFIEARKLKQANLEKAQADLRLVLSIRQEAIASYFGLL